MDYATVGQILNTHGIKGDFKVRSLMDTPEQLLEYESFWLDKNDLNVKTLQVKKARIHQQLLIVSFDSINDIDKAMLYQGFYLMVPADQLPALPFGTYYRKDLLNIEVVAPRQGVLGTIVDIIETGAHDVYVVKNSDDREILLPNIPQVVKSVDLIQKQMMVELIDGMLEEGKL